jgi:MFS family permease
MAAGYVLASIAPSLFLYALAQGLLIGMLGSSATFGPLLADISHWFERRRGLAVAICACGNYLAGTVWPPIVQHLIETVGWRSAHVYIGVFCLLAMLPLTWAMRRRPPHHATETSAAMAAKAELPLGVSPGVLQTLLVIAGLACCVAMSMPQVHIVAYCADLARARRRPCCRDARLRHRRLLTGWTPTTLAVRTLLLARRCKASR